MLLNFKQRTSIPNKGLLFRLYALLLIIALFLLNSCSSPEPSPKTCLAIQYKSFSKNELTGDLSYKYDDKFVYDDQNRLIKVVGDYIVRSDTGSYITDIEYDNQSRIIHVENNNGYEDRVEYLENEIRVIQNENTVSIYVHDSKGRTIEMRREMLDSGYLLNKVEYEYDDENSEFTTIIQSGSAEPRRHSTTKFIENKLYKHPLTQYPVVISQDNNSADGVSKVRRSFYPINHGNIYITEITYFGQGQETSFIFNQDEIVNSYGYYIGPKPTEFKSSEYIYECSDSI